MDQSTLESGFPRPRSDRAEACKYGRMGLCMRATLGTTRSMGWEGYCIRMVKFIKVSGKMTMPMGLDATLIKMVHFIKVGG